MDETATTRPAMNGAELTLLLAAAGAAAYWLLRRAPAFLPASTPTRVDAARDAQLEGYARWFIHMRWVGLLLAVVWSSRTLRPAAGQGP